MPTRSARCCTSSPLTPGTTPDIIARAIAPQLQASLGMAPVVENKAGASGMIGMGSVAKLNDPGMLLVVPSTTVTPPLFYKSMDFDVINSFTPITQVASSSFVLVVHKDVPASNLAEFVTWARAKQGQFYVSPGNGKHHHIFMELLLQSTGVRLEHVPYKGSAPAVNNLLGGQVPTIFMPIQVAVPLRDAGRLKIIGGSLRNRHPGFPDIPSLQEKGAKNYHADPWFSVWGTPKMPAAPVERYRAAIVAALADPSVSETLTKQGLILKSGTPAELVALSNSESALWTRVVRESNIKPE